MNQETDRMLTSDHVGGRVRDVRKSLGLSAGQLAEMCAEFGMPELTEQAIFNLESGRRDEGGQRRRRVTVDELMALAAVLRVQPLHLLVPLYERQPDADALTPTRVLAASVKRHRKRYGWSAADLAERMGSAGFKWDRFTVQNLESGRRESASLDETFALARVLGVALIHLLFPVETDDEVIRICAEDSYMGPAVEQWALGRCALNANPDTYFGVVGLGSPLG